MSIEGMKKVNEMIKDIYIAMLTTVDSAGRLTSRPMGIQHNDFDGTLWFFTQYHSSKVNSIESDQHVNVAFSDIHKSSYVSMVGKATVVLEKSKMKELWTPVLKAWFPEGLDSPDMALLRIDVESAEYWDGPGTTVVKALGLAKSLLTGETYKGGGHEKIQILH